MKAVRKIWPGALRKKFALSEGKWGLFVLYLFIFLLSCAVGVFVFFEDRAAYGGAVGPRLLRSVGVVLICVACFTMFALAFCSVYLLYRVPGLIRFRRMIRAQERYRGELDDILAGDAYTECPGEPAVFVAGDWLIALGRLAVRRGHVDKLCQAKRAELYHRFFRSGAARVIRVFKPDLKVKTTRIITGVTVRFKDLPWTAVQIPTRQWDAVTKFISRWRKAEDVADGNAR